MRIVRKKFENTSIGEQYEHKLLSVTIVFEGDELDPKLAERFGAVQVEQTHWIGDPLRTWMKGTRSKWFNHETKDPQKKLIWNLVNDFMKENNTLIVTYTPHA